MSRSVLILGAGMVGTATALHLQQRGFAVVLLDRRRPGEETSHGNGGIIQREAAEPYPFPRDLATLVGVALGRDPRTHYHWRALPAIARALSGYFRASGPARYAGVARAYAALIAHCLTEHESLITAAGADALITREGFHHVFRTHAALDDMAAKAERVSREYGVASQVIDGAALAREEPAVRMRLAGAVRWRDPWCVSDPGELVRRYATLFERRGGSLASGDADSLAATRSGWRIQTSAGSIEAQSVVVALGPWSDAFVRRLGYRLPLFVKRGYHQHYAGPALKRSLLDAERGFLLAPMARGVRMTTGAEFALLDAPATPIQVARSESSARELMDLGHPLDATPWLGARPCTADMLPVIGPAPRHRGLWFHFGHAHQGFTLGPATGRLLAEMMAGETPFVDPAAYAVTRF